MALLAAVTLLAFWFPTNAAADVLPPSPAGARAVPADYDGDGKTDIAVKGSNGIWYIDIGANGGRWDFAYPGYGDSRAMPVPADYDGDGRADLAVKDSSGMWAIDFASNHFGVWDAEYFGYGDATGLPVPADYDGDHRADLAVKTGTGDWYIDYSFNGFAGWDVHVTGYGDATGVPVPADYDGDGRADLAVKSAGGWWHIDYASDGFGAWNEIHGGYGGATAVPVPADYDRDGRADLAVKDGGGYWLVDYASDGFGAWNVQYAGRGGSWSLAVPADYDGDGRLDLSVVDTSGVWFIDFAFDGYAAWNLVIDNPHRVLLDTTAPWIDSTDLYGPAGKLTKVNGQFPLRIGVRYMVALHIQPGNGAYYAGVEINPDLYVPQSLNVINRVGSTGHVRITSAHTRRFALTCSQPGSFPLGFMMRDIGPPVGTGNAFNQDYGVRVECTAAQPGLYGVVTRRVQTSNGRFVPGAPIAGATVSIGTQSTSTASNGTWSLPFAAGGPLRLTVTKSGFSRVIAVNIRVPAGSGMQVDTQLEDPFTGLASRGMKYTTYIDYSRGRTIFHVVRIDMTLASVKLAKTNITSSGYKTVLQNAIDRGTAAVAAMNGGYFDNSGKADASVGYFYSRGFVASEFLPGGNVLAEPSQDVLEPASTLPLLTIKGTGTHQQIAIVQSEADFESPSSSQWKQVGSPSHPIWDVDRNGVSDVDYAMQCSPSVLKNRVAIWRGNYDSGSEYQMAWARTAFGVAPAGVAYMVVADGEGVNGGNGASLNQLGEFFRNTLGATSAMNFDGGLSTEMVLLGAGGMRRVNTITGEDSSWDVDPTTTSIFGGGSGAVFTLLTAGN